MLAKEARAGEHTMSAAVLVNISPGLDTAQLVLWCLYLVSAVMLPMYHIPSIISYLRGTNGIGDACIRSETLQCFWRFPALLFAVFVIPSLPLLVSILLDMTGRSVKVWAMFEAQRRYEKKSKRTDDCGSSVAVLEAADSSAATTVERSRALAVPGASSV